MKNRLLTDARIAVQGLALNDLNVLTGTEKDLSSEAYLKIKDYLRHVSHARPGSRFVYILGKRSDGMIIFLVDSENMNSPGYSPPGQEFHEASSTTRDVFITLAEVVEGPVSDRWGRWVSGYIPVNNSRSPGEIFVFGIDVDASQWESEIYQAGIIPILVTLIILLITVLSYLFWTRNNHEKELLRKAEELARTHAEELARISADLEHKVNERTAETSKLNKELQDHAEVVDHLLIQKDHFIFQLAHDLRTPLTPMVAILPLLKEGIIDPDSRTLIDMFQKSLDYMQMMVEDILEFVHLNSKHSIDDYEDVLVHDLIEEEINRNSFIATEKEIRFWNNVPKDLTIRLSRVYSHQLFRNLINNAIKFNSFKGSVTIGYDHSYCEHIFSITDTGVGISQENITRIWDEFYIADNSRVDPESKGLGLSMVHKIVTLHGGKITATSDGIGKGSVFSIFLPK